jgi:hypothetical protein
MKWGQPGPFEIIETEAFASSSSPAQAGTNSVSSNSVSSNSVSSNSVSSNSDPATLRSASAFQSPEMRAHGDASTAPSLAGQLSFQASTAHAVASASSVGAAPTPLDHFRSSAFRPFTIFRKALLPAFPSAKPKPSVLENVLATSAPSTSETPPTTSGSRNPFTAVEAPVEAPRRRYDCQNYCTCLDLAAALNWDNFTCRGCSGDIDEKLLWRARQALRKDEVARQVCDLPAIGVAAKGCGSENASSEMAPTENFALKSESGKETAVATSALVSKVIAECSGSQCSGETAQAAGGDAEKRAHSHDSAGAPNPKRAQGKSNPAGLSLATKR